MKTLKRSRSNRKICGVCGGLGEYMNLDPTLVRLLMGVLVVVSLGTALLVYFIAALIMPEE